MAPQVGRAVIMGAGPAGLATGYALSRAGWSVSVYDQSTMIGGLARTERRGDFRFDIGGHRWFTKKDELNLFLMDLLGDELGLTDRISRIYFGGKFVDYPLKVGDVVQRIGPVTSMRAVGDFVMSKASQTISKKPVVSMEDAYIAQFGRTLYELFFKNYSEKVWGDDCAELSGDWVTQRSRGLSLLTTVREAIKRSDTKVESLVERFMYPKLGYGRISEKMAEAIEAAGGSVNLGWRVTEVLHDHERVTAIRVSNGSREELVTGNAFISSIPMTELCLAMSPTADGSLRTAANSLSYRDIITVNLMLDRPQVTNDTWVYIHEPSVSFARLHEPRNWSPQMAPEGKTSLCLEIFCQADDPHWRTSDDVLIERTANELDRVVGFISAKEVIDGFVVRCRDAYPRYSLGYQSAVDAIKTYLRSFPNLSIVGRGGTFRYNNADHSIETGLLAARNVLGEAADVDTVNSEQEYLEERRVPVSRTAAPAS